MALIVRRAALRGFGSTVGTVLGLELGIYLWALAAGAGLAAIVAASQTAYLVLRVVGAAFLVLLGVRAWITAVRGREARPRRSRRMPRGVRVGASRSARASWCSWRTPRRRLVGGLSSDDRV